MHRLRSCVRADSRVQRPDICREYSLSALAGQCGFNDLTHLENDVFLLKFPHLHGYRFHSTQLVLSATKLKIERSLLRLATRFNLYSSCIIVAKLLCDLQLPRDYQCFRNFIDLLSQAFVAHGQLFVFLLSTTDFSFYA